MFIVGKSFFSEILSKSNIKTIAPTTNYQLSGLNVTINVTPENKGSRVTELQVMDIDGNFSDIKYDQVYNVALPSFLAGTNFQRQMRGVFDDSILSHTVGDVMIYEALKDYIKANTPLAQAVDGRLSITNTTSGANVRQGLFG